MPYAEVISSGDTEEVPRVSGQTGASGLVMPIRWATRATRVGPTWSITWAKTALTESAVASQRG